jgi:hypothetical protein
VYGIIDTDHSSLPVRLRILASSAFHFHTADDDEYGKLIPRDAYMELPDMHKGGVYRPALPRQVRFGFCLSSFCLLFCVSNNIFVPSFLC